jgi:energy coupling factor transporter S component ThiW
MVKKIPLTRMIAMTIGLTGLGVVLSPFFIPVGPIKAYPFQHMINIIAGILLGPFWAASIATLVGIIRNMLGLGTLFAFPGGIPGGLIVGILYHYLKIKRDIVAFSENIGTTVIGATLAYYLLVPAIGVSVPPVMGISGVWALWIMFEVSCGSGAIIGYIVIKTLRKIGITEYFASS